MPQGESVAVEVGGEERLEAEPLEFTGNWFIDAGILGFVNLMEEVYGWDLEELQRRIREDEEAVFYWYFPIGYICHVVREVKRKNRLEREKINDIINKIPQAPKTTNKNDLFEKAWEWITNNEKLFTETKKGKNTIKRLGLSWSGIYRVLTNFPLFQPKHELEKQKDIFMSLLGLKEIENELLIYIDKTTTKFLPSSSDFPNISYTKSCITMNVLLSLTPRAPIFVLTYPLAFISESRLLNSFGYWVMFYSPELKFTYNVNKKLKMYIKEFEQENRDIFKITWNSIIDSLTESESIWSLENMYLIKVEPPRGNEQDFRSAEYIGIPKLQASIIIDDTLRNALNVNLPTPKKERGRSVRVWILEEFIKNKPLTPHFINYLHQFLNNNKKSVKKRDMIHSLAVDAQIKELNWSRRIFSTNFFNRYKEIVFNIKDDANKMFQISTIVRLFYDSDKRVAIKLLSTIRKNNKYAFSNIFLRILLENKNNLDNGKLRDLNNYLFEKIISNNKNWENYALAVVCGLAY